MTKDKKRILGIDPGFGRIGFGIIDGRGRDWKAVGYGCIETSTKDSFIKRLEELHIILKKILKKYNPDLAAVEDLFFYKNVTTAIKVGQARGAILLTLRQARIAVEEFTPLQIKQAVTGYGRAEKSQIQKMVQVQLSMKEKPRSDDAADALAVALTCAYSMKMREIINKKL